MQVRCPQCEETIGVSADSSLAHIACTTCGSAFSLYSDRETTTVESVNAAVGHFTMLEKLGAGAFGVVWKARDTKLDRIVAIKIPRLDRMDSDGEAQFLREAQAAAQLKHPNIVRVHEVGRQDDSIYIVNEFIHGVTLADYLTGLRPNFRQAAELCAAIADALQHAHDQGVVHRDLKPANVMLDRNDKPYIMDFGLAKRDVTDVTISVDGKIMGTPAYMSPEQASGHGNSADGRTDIYSLGGILFELLTGERPFRGSFRMLMHQVINDDPPLPRKLNSNVPRDLETICLKCLRKSPDNRYATAAELAADLRHWLNREPIQARPVSRPERLIRWCQRKPAIATLTGLIALVTVAGFTGITWQWLKADRLRVEAEANLKESELQRERRNANFQTAVDAVDTMLTRVADKSLNLVPRMDRVRRNILEDAAAFYEGFLVEKSDDPDLIAETARAYTKIGEIRASLDELDKARDAFDHSINLLEEIVSQYPDEDAYRRRLTFALSARAMFLATNSNISDAIADGKRAIETLQEIVDSQPDNQKDQIQLAQCFCDLGAFLTQTSDVESAVEHCQTAIAILQKLDGEKELVRWQSTVGYGNLAEALRKLHGNSPEVEEAWTQANQLTEALYEEFPDQREYRVALIRSQRALAYLLTDTNRIDDADAKYQQLAEAWNALSRDYPHIPAYQDGYASAVMDWAIMYARLGKLTRSIELIKEGTQILESLVKDLPRPGYRKSLSTAYTNLGAMLLNTGQAEQAEPYMLKAIAIREQLLSEFPDIPAYQLDVNISCTNLANAILVRDDVNAGNMSAERLNQADVLLVRAIEVGERLVAEQSSNPLNNHKLALSYRVHGQLWANEDPTKAEASFRKSLELMRQLTIEAPRDSKTKRQLSYSLDQLADILLKLDRKEESAAAAIEANEVIATLAKEADQYMLWKDYGINTRKLGERYQHFGNYTEALKSYQSAVQTWTKIVDQSPENPDANEQFDISRDALARFLVTCPDEGLRDPAEAIRLAESVSERAPDDEFFQSTLGLALYRTGDFKKSLAAMSKARELGLQPDPTDDLYYAMALWQVDQKSAAQSLHRDTLARIKNDEQTETGNRTDGEVPSADLIAEVANLIAQ